MVATAMLAATQRPTVLWSPSPPAVFLAPTCASDREGPTLDADSVSDLLPGTMLPRTRVEIRGRIGEGGGGVVYRGIHIDLQRTLAIKVTCDRRAEARERFLNEARAATRIESPHVVEVVDFGELPDGRAWYAMEYVPGRSLARLLHAEGGLPAERALALLKMACRGLAATHAAGIVHRDIKPGNFVVRRRDGGDELVIVDFGLAARAGRRVHDVCGTPEYMAPEQVEAGVVDARTDVYALGCCAYEMLTGDTAVQATDAEAILHEHLDGLRLRWPEHVPAELREVVERCVARWPDERFADMAELERELDRVGAGLATASGTRGSSTTSPTFTARTIALVLPRRGRVGRLARQAGWVLAGATAGMLVGLVGLEAASARDVEPAPATEHRASASPDDDATRMAALAATTPVPSTESRAPRPSAASALVVETILEEGPEESPDLETVPALDETAPPTVEGGDEGQQGTARPRAGELVRRGRRALARGDRSAAEKAFKAALRRDPDRASALAGMADVEFERGDHRSSLSYAKAAVRHAPRSASHHVRLGDAFYRLDRKLAARRAYRQAERLGSKVAVARLRRLDG